MSYSVEFMQRHGVVHLGGEPGRAQVGVTAAPSPALRSLLQSFHCGPVEFRMLEEAELRVRMQRAAGDTDIRFGHDEYGVGILETENDAPAVNLVNSLLNNAVRHGASDVHLQQHGDLVQIRYRIDGLLRNLGEPLAAVRFRSVSSRVKVLAGMNGSERRRPQDGRFTARVTSDSFDVRVSSMPTVDGESLVLRLFPQSQRTKGLSELGMPLDIRRHVESVIDAVAGFLVICGPTGSGKTTTLHAALGRINTGERKIITVEDPVEYRLPGIEQIQTNEAAGLTFDSLLRRVLRRDPDVIMVGEIRDEETAALSVRAALTGHLVLATVHSRSVTEVSERLVNLGVPQHLIGLLAPSVLSQRLIRTRCADCADGCPRCFGTGLRGRTGVFGLLRPGGLHVPIERDAREKLRLGMTNEREVAWTTG